MNPILPLPAEGGTGGRVGAPHAWLLPLAVIHTPGPALHGVQAKAPTHVHRPAPVLLPSEGVDTRVMGPLLPGPPFSPQDEGPRTHRVLHVHWLTLRDYGLEEQDSSVLKVNTSAMSPNCNYYN